MPGAALSLQPHPGSLASGAKDSLAFSDENRNHTVPEKDRRPSPPPRPIQGAAAANILKDAIYGIHLCALAAL